MSRPRRCTLWRLAIAVLVGVTAPVAGQQLHVPPLGATSGLPNIPIPNPSFTPTPLDSQPLIGPGPTFDTPPPPLTEGLLPTVPQTDFLPPTAIEADPYPPAPNPAMAAATPPDEYPPLAQSRKPLPGSLASEVDRYFAAKSLFRYCTWRDCTISAFPSTLLWEPPLAIFREPRMAAYWTSLNNYRGPETLETSLGTTFGLFRFEPIGTDLAIQTDLFGVVHTRLSPDDVMAQSYRFGFPVTFRRGPWTGKIGYEHTSDHLGDELIFRTGRGFTRYAKDELVIALSRYFYDSLRIYGQWSYAAYQDLPRAFNRNRYDLGFEYYDRQPTGFTGTPFVAFNATWRGELNFVPITQSQLGWIWRNPEARLASFRVFGTYYSGGSPYGQFFQDGREHWWGLGFAGDY
jgi:hypothetical protein